LPEYSNLDVAGFLGRGQFGIRNTNEKLSKVITPLLSEEVSGYIVISKSASEHSSIQMAKVSARFLK